MPSSAESLPGAASLSVSLPWSRRAPIQVCLALITVLSLSSVHVYLGPLARVRPVLLLTAAALGFAFLQPRSVRWNIIVKSPIGRILIAILAVAVFSAPFGLSVGGSAAFLIDEYFKIILVCFLTTVAIRNSADLSLFVWAFVSACAILAVLSFTVAPIEVTRSGLRRVGGGGMTMFDANDLGMVMVMCIPLAALCVESSRGIPKWIALGVLFASVSVIIQTGSRGAFLGLAVVFTFLLFLVRRISISRRLAAVAIVVAGSAAFASEAYWTQMSTILRPSEDYNSTADIGRVAIAKRGLGYMIARPFSGVGIGNFMRAEGTRGGRVNMRTGNKWIAPHNTFVQVGVELGFAGLALWIALLYASSVSLFRLGGKLKRSALPESIFLEQCCRYVPVAIIGFLVCSMFLSHAFTPPAYCLFAIAAGLQVAARTAVRQGRLARGRPPSHLAGSRHLHASQ